MAAQPYPHSRLERSTTEMFAHYPQSQFRPCPDCGTPVPDEEEDAHRCEKRRFVEYQMLLLRPEIVGFEAELSDWLDTPQGRFALYYARRERRLVAA